MEIQHTVWEKNLVLQLIQETQIKSKNLKSPARTWRWVPNLTAIGQKVIQRGELKIYMLWKCQTLLCRIICTREPAIKMFLAPFFLLSYNDRATRKTIFRFCYNLYQADPFFVTNLLDYDICEILLVLDSIKVFFFRVSLKIFWFYLRYSTQIPGHWKNLRKRRFWN